MKTKVNIKKRGLILSLALLLVVGGVIGGTLAWLTAKTDPIVNTFTTSGIEIELEESDDLNLQMVPGVTITKDPVVTVKADSEKNYLFVKLEKSANFDNFMTYTMADGWTQLTGVTGVDNVWYRVVNADAADQEFGVLADNKVVVKDTVTKAMMDALTDATNPTLTVTAYASQFSKDNATSFTAAQAWANIA